MNMKNFEYLRDQVKFTGFGESLENELKAKIEKQTPEFSIKHPISYGQATGEATLQFKKSNSSDLYFFNSYDLAIKQPNQSNEVKQTFFIGKENSITLKEAFNLLSGRAINKDWHKLDKVKENGQIRYVANGEKYNAWMQLDFKNVDEKGNFKSNRFHENYQFDLEKALEKYPIKELANQQGKDQLLESLKKGNRQAVTFVEDGVAKQKFIEANPKDRIVNVYEGKTMAQKQENNQSQKPQEAVVKEIPAKKTKKQGVKV